MSHNRFDAYLSHGKVEPAVASLERALLISPDDEATAKSLIAACLRAGRTSRAEDLKRDFSRV